MAARLRLSRKESTLLALYCRAIGSDTGLGEIAYREGAQAAIDITLLRAALSGSTLPDDLIARAEHAAGQRFPVRAADITTGETGPALGKRLKELEAAWIASGFRLSREQLLA